MKAKFVAAGITGFMFVLLILLLLNFDVAPIGPEGTSIGLSQINQSVFDLIGVNGIWYDITEATGYISILAALVLALIGLAQLIKRKSIRKVDKRLLALGVLYLAVIALFVLFELAVVNYRPVIMPGDEHPEASFPSTHTMLACVIMGSTAMLAGKYIRNSVIRLSLQALCTAVMVITVVGRLISGVHWFTDIIGGILISAALLLMYSGALDKLEISNTEKETGSSFSA